jgi:hypothetical protein
MRDGPARKPRGAGATRVLRVFATVLVAAACVYFVVPAAESPGVGSAEPVAASEGAEFAETEGVPTLELPAMEAARQSLIAEAPPADETAVAGTSVLRVTLEGITDEDAREATVTVAGVDAGAEWPSELRDSWPCQGLSSEFDLDPFLASVAVRDGDLPIHELEITVDHPLHVVETHRIPLSSGVELVSGQIVYEVSVRLVPAFVIHGQLAREDGTPAASGLVGILLLEEGFPIEDIAHGVECAADGAFELRGPASGPHALVSYEEGRRPTTTHVEALVGTRVDVGTLVVDPGHAITGHVLRRGRPMGGTSVYATPPRWMTAAAPEAIASGMHGSVYEGRSVTTPARSVRLLWLTPTTTFTNMTTRGSRRGGRFELTRQWEGVDENGAFAFGALGSGEYLLRMGQLAEVHDSLPGYWGDDARRDELIYINGEKGGLPVRAPEHGVVLHFRETTIRFELAGDLESEDEGRLLLKTRSPHPTAVDEDGKDLRVVANPQAKNFNFMPEFFTWEHPLPGDEPTYVLQAPPDKHITGEVVFAGRRPVPLDFSTTEAGGEVVVPVELVRVEEELASLVILLENLQAEIPETFSVLLSRAGQGGFAPETRHVEVESGQLRVEGILPGTYRVRVRPGVDRDYPTGLFFDGELDLELPPGREVTRSILLERCAGLRLTVRGEDGELVGGEFEFFDPSGMPVSLLLDVGEGQRRGYSYTRLYPYGTHEAANPLQPGRYRLVLITPDHEERSVTVELRAGEYEHIDVTLSPR